MSYKSWGNYPIPQGQSIQFHGARHSALQLKSGQKYLPRGEGRSYGDSCLIDHGTLLSSAWLDHLISFDETSGILEVESGVTLDQILQFSVPRGWFLPVTPGTKFVSVGGAIANDVHGKNHHVRGSFGHFVLGFQLLRSTGERLYCSSRENPSWFAATIGGLGLTGFITQAKIQLIPIKSSFINQTQVRFSDLSEFIELTKTYETLEYSVAWVDCLSEKLRGIFICGDHSEVGVLEAHSSQKKLVVPIDMPRFLLNKSTIKVFNELYYRKNIKKIQQSVRVNYDSFFYPLDSIHQWNKIYGTRGFLQYQFVIPMDANNDQMLAEIFRTIANSRLGSFLAVLKVFGDIPSVGMLSFPKKGMTLALDFPNTPVVFKLLEKCDEIVRACQGRVYPAKDARMSSETFKVSYPNFNKFFLFIDPSMTSNFWRRVI